MRMFVRNLESIEIVIDHMPNRRILILVYLQGTSYVRIYIIK